MFEVESEILSTAIDCKGFHEYVPEYGHRAWKAKGKSIDIIYWDTGNGWCAILDVIPHKGRSQVEVIRFYKKLKMIISRCYDENGYRRG